MNKVVKKLVKILIIVLFQSSYAQASFDLRNFLNSCEVFLSAEPIYIKNESRLLKFEKTKSEDEFTIKFTEFEFNLSIEYFKYLNFSQISKFKKFEAMAQLVDGDTIFFDLTLSDYGFLDPMNQNLNYRSQFIRGKVFYRAAFDFFKNSIKKVNSEWSDGDNLEMFIENVKIKKMSYEEAAINTWEGQMLSQLGFKNVKIEKINFRNNGEIRSVYLKFY